MTENNSINFQREPLLTETEIKVRMAEMVLEIARDLQHEELTVIGILRGSFMFMADLVRLLYVNDIHPLIDFVFVTSYEGTESTGHLNLLRDMSLDVKDRKVLIVDDILDTGRTLKFTKEYIIEREAMEVSTCVLLDKPSRRTVPINADYVGFSINDVFVVGYGLDYNGRYRDLPYLGVIDCVEVE
ncbi:hypoxanthine phosphoribosyltransferase [candidate division LCP-89 bacterium B3_LCP]|uniref:Hypoxanthine phosphoribosyltransferase n=1 Tax=candidate division LCP-89 bacterium B3_LCP TaxID=2012998 RepID=A0A532V2M1_UNCL8|nr:MAG: hypoxanthine phosphoribosyltransferase [candidate division LCP-89 bacterium B3_LCP]